MSLSNVLRHLVAISLMTLATLMSPLSVAAEDVPERSEIAEKVVPFVNHIARSLPLLATVQVDSRDSSTRLPPHLPSTDDEMEAQNSRNSRPILSEYDVHPVLKAIQPTLDDFDVRLKSIEDKLDLVIARK